MARAKHLAQANLAWMLHPLQDASMFEFREGLARVNATAEQAPGFVWRFQTEVGDATDVRVLGDPLVLFNMSVWQSIEDLKRYTYRELHGDFFRKRREWFHSAERPSLVLWWIEAGQLPTVEQALGRFDRLWEAGPSPRAFTLKNAFDAAGNLLIKNREIRM